MTKQTFIERGRFFKSNQKTTTKNNTLQMTLFPKVNETKLEDGKDEKKRKPQKENLPLHSTLITIDKSKLYTDIEALILNHINDQKISFIS